MLSKNDSIASMVGTVQNLRVIAI